MFKVRLDVYLMCYLAQDVKLWGNRDKKKIHCKDKSVLGLFDKKKVD